MPRPLPDPLPDPLSELQAKLQAHPLPHPRTGVAFTSPVPPGAGWPGDPAAADTPVAGHPAAVAEAASTIGDLPALDAAVSVCRACPRLVSWREQVALTGRRSYAGQPYWGRPVPGWGSPRPGILLLGLAPAAHGGNRTGRVFTGDRSGDHLAAALHRVGLAAHPTSTDATDGQVLAGPRGRVRMSAAVHCAPPANRPDPAEARACAPWLHRELRLLAPDLRVVVALGGIAWAALLAALPALGMVRPRPAPRFGHGAVWHLPEALPGGPAPLVLLGCYHPSQQNTFTGRLTPAMTQEVLARAADLAAGHDERSGPPSRISGRAG